MQDRTNKSVANSLEVEEHFLNYMPYLLQDLWALGSSVDIILDYIKTIPFKSKKNKVLDLGCGKGAVSVKIASRFGFEVVGIDAMYEFIEIAKTKASEYFVSDNCTFIQEDILTYVSEPHNFDIAILASLGGIFGDNIKTIKHLRTQVKAGGYIIIDDGFLKNKKLSNRKGYAHCKDSETTLKELMSFGDYLEYDTSTVEISKNINSEYLKVIEQRGNELIKLNPNLKDYIQEYLALQREECEFINNEFEGRLWVFRKAEI